MPCFCHYDPPEEAKRKIKELSRQLVNEIIAIERVGDPLGFSFRHVMKLLEHLYTGKCDEKS